MNRRQVTIKLADGPCSERYASVLAYGDDCWQRFDREEVWCRYVKNLFRPGEYVWSGEALTEAELKLKVHTDTHNTYGATQGA